jgi:hypothetical protein
MSGSLIVFEGPDHSGKSTQIEAVANKLKNLIWDCDRKYIWNSASKFPRYGLLTGDMINYMIHNKEAYDLKHCKAHMDLFSHLQLQDKIGGIESIYQQLKNSNFVFLDRYTLSARVYDAAARLMAIKGVTEEQIKHWEDALWYHNGAGNGYMGYNATRLYELINSWIFNITYFTGKAEEFKQGYEFLEHKIFDIHHVLFRSSNALTRIAEEERPMDQYEDDGLFKRFVNCLYDNIPGAIEYYRLTSSHSPFIDIPYICSDITQLLIKQFNINIHRETREGIEDKLYGYCKSHEKETLELVADDIAQKLYESFKKKEAKELALSAGK